MHSVAIESFVFLGAPYQHTSKQVVAMEVCLFIISPLMLSDAVIRTDKVVSHRPNVIRVQVLKAFLFGLGELAKAQLV